LKSHSRRFLDAKHSDRLKFLENGILSLALDLERPAARLERQDATWARWIADAIVDVGIPRRSARRVQRHKKRVRPFTGLVDRVGGVLVQKQDGAIPDVHVDVADRSVERRVDARSDAHDCVSPPVAPDDAASAGEDALNTAQLMFWPCINFGAVLGTYHQPWLLQESKPE
jgi:hypothetical protein